MARGERDDEERGEEAAVEDASTPSAPRIGDRGFGESDIPDPMPKELRDEPDQTEHVDEMGGESPTG